VAAEAGIDVEGLEENLKALHTLELRADDQSPVWAAVAPFLHEAAMRRFQSGSQPTNWPPLKHPHLGPTLVQSGKMRDAIREKPGRTGITQRSSQRYSWVQQHGSEKSLGGFLSLTQATALVLAGAKVKQGGRKARNRVWVKGRGWAYVSKRGATGRGKKRRLKREQAGRGGIDARPFLFFADGELDQVVLVLTNFMVEAFGEGAVHGPA